MGIVRLPHGPWKSLLVGKYEDRDVSIYQNPQRDILYVVVDRDERGEPKGLVVTVYRGFFVERGDSKTLLNHLSGSPVGVTKKWKGGLFQFILLPAGIKYIGLDPQELSETVDTMVNTLSRMEKNFLLLVKTLGMQARPLSLVPKNVAAVMFTEPSVIAGLTPVGRPLQPEGALILGYKRTGEPAREGAENLRRTVVYGVEEGRKHIFLVLLEEFLRNGINTLVVTRNASAYEGLKRAGKESQELKKLGLHPMGLNVSQLEPFIDMRMVDPVVFSYLIGVEPQSETGKTLVRILKEGSQDVDRPAQLADRIAETDLYSMRAGRVLRVVDNVKGELFRPLTYNHFVSRSATGLGSAFVLEVKGPWEFLSLYSYLKGIGEALKRAGRFESVRLVLFVEEAERFFSKEENPVTNAFIGLLDAYKDFGLGWVLETEKDVSLHSLVLAMVETKLGAVGPDDIAVRTIIRRPYRLKPRPLLTAAGQAPSASSPQVPPPGHR